MAKGRSKKAGKPKSRAGAADLGAAEIVAKTPKGLRKQLRRLESQLVEAARIESKRLRKLERARGRRQIAEAALAYVLFEAEAVPVASKAGKPASAPDEANPVAATDAKPAAPAPAKPRATRAPAAKPAVKPASAPAIKPVVKPAAAPAAAPRRTTSKPPAAPAAPDKP
jgi:hypothetical protein